MILASQEDSRRKTGKCYGKSVAMAAILPQQQAQLL